MSVELFTQSSYSREENPNGKPMAYLHAIHFSLEEAQTMLVEVVSILENIRDAKKRLDAIGYDIRGHHFFAGMGTNGTKPYPDRKSVV